MAVFEKVQEIIVEELGKEPSEVTLESTFEDLEADSLDLFQVISFCIPAHTDHRSLSHRSNPDIHPEKSN